MADIACFEIRKWQQKILKKKLKKHKIQFFPKKLTSRSCKKITNCSILVVFVYSQVNEKILDALPKLRCIVTMSTGFDHIDIKACKKRNITVCNIPHYGENTVAEHTFALLLAISRKIPQSIEKTRMGKFDLAGLRGFDLKKKVMGVVGTGQIGRHVIQYAKAFGMDVIAYDIYKDQRLAKRLGFRYVSFKSILKKSDILSFHVPYTKKTKHMLNENNLKDLKKGIIIMNTARGGVIETDALLHGLNKGIISFAGLDVLEGECFVKEDTELLSSHFSDTCDLKTLLQDHLLLKHPQVFVTPHNAFNSEEALKRILDTTVQNIAQFLKKRPINKL